VVWNLLDAMHRANAGLLERCFAKVCVQPIFHHSLTPLLLCGESWGDRILFLHAGKILASGTSDEIKERFSGKDLDEVFVKIARNKIEALHL
jgi:ABC-type hemin transport system ATPase subunit